MKWNSLLLLLHVQPSSRIDKRNKTGRNDITRCLSFHFRFSFSRPFSVHRFFNHSFFAFIIFHVTLYDISSPFSSSFGYFASSAWHEWKDRKINIIWPKEWQSASDVLEHTTRELVKLKIKAKRTMRKEKRKKCRLLFECIYCLRATTHMQRANKKN